MTAYDPRDPALDLSEEDSASPDSEPSDGDGGPSVERDGRAIHVSGPGSHTLSSPVSALNSNVGEGSEPMPGAAKPSLVSPADISPAQSFPMAEAAGIPWRADGRPVEWAPRPNSLFDGRPWVPVPGGGVGPPPPWVAEGPAGVAAEESDSGHRARALVREIVETSLLALLVFLCVRATFQNFKVDGTSMYPTLENGEFLVVNKLVYAKVDLEKIARWLPFIDPGDEPERHVFGGPKRGDIVVLKHPSHPETDLIKRVIGLPGEIVEVRGNDVFIDDQLLVEPYIKMPGGQGQDRIKVPEGEYFVMGDNRAHSSDSRAFGFAAEELIIGRSIVIYWPTDRFGLAPNEEATVQAAFLPVTAATAPLFGARTATFFIELLFAITVLRLGFRKSASAVSRIGGRVAVRAASRAVNGS